MKKILPMLLGALLSQFFSLALAWELQDLVPSANNVPSSTFVEVDPTQNITVVLDRAMKNLKPIRSIDHPVATLQDAVAHLLASLSIAHAKRACTDYADYFWFSGLNDAKPDDGSFRSGVAVEKRTGHIFEWNFKE